MTDRDGNAVLDLTRDDFVLLDDGVEQAITTATFVDFSVESPVSRMVPEGIEPDVVTNAVGGRMWVMLLGSSSTRPGDVLRAREVARRFVETSMGPNDQVAIVPVFGTMSAAQGFTRNRRRLISAIERLRVDDPGAVSDDGTAPVGDPTRTAFQVLEELCLRLADVGGGGKAVLFFDPPQAWTPTFEMRDAVRCATRHNVAV